MTMSMTSNVAALQPPLVVTPQEAAGSRDGETAEKPTLEPERWLPQYGDFLFRYAMRRLRDRSAAEDAVQDALVAALRAQSSFAGRSSERTWLTGILKHKVIDQLRKRGRVFLADNEDQLNRSAENFFDAQGKWRAPPGEWTRDPEKRFQQVEFRAVFEKCLKALPPRLALAFSLREIDGLSGTEICELMGITQMNYWVMLHRARLRLRAGMEATWLRESASDSV